MILMSIPELLFYSVFFFNDTATTEIYTLSLHDALPISSGPSCRRRTRRRSPCRARTSRRRRSEEHTSELQSQSNLVCRLLLEKKKLLQASLPSPRAPNCRCSPRSEPRLLHTPPSHAGSV